MVSSPPTTPKHTMKSKSASTTTIKKSKQAKPTKKPLMTVKTSPTESTLEQAEAPSPEIDLFTGLPIGYSAAKPNKLQALLDERDSFADYTCQVLDPNESMVMVGRLAKIQEEARRWNRSVRLDEAAKHVSELAGEVANMDDEEMIDNERRVAVLEEQIKEFEKKVAERKALGEENGVNDGEDDLVKEKDTPEGKDRGPDGDDENKDREEKGNEAIGGAGQNRKKRKRGAE